MSWQILFLVILGKILCNGILQNSFLLNALRNRKQSIWGQGGDDVFYLQNRRRKLFLLPVVKPNQVAVFSNRSCNVAE
jgi:hypothetical protein